MSIVLLSKSDIIKETIKAINTRDWQALKKLYPLVGMIPDELREKLGRMSNKPDPVAVEFTGLPYQAKNLWYVPSKIEHSDGSIKTEEVMIKLFECDGKKYGFVVSGKE